MVDEKLAAVGLDSAAITAAEVARLGDPAGQLQRIGCRGTFQRQRGSLAAKVHLHRAFGIASHVHSPDAGLAGIGHAQGHAVAVPEGIAIDDVFCPHEGGHIRRSGTLENLLRGADLGDPALVQHHHAVCHHHGFFTVMRDQDGGQVQSFLNRADFMAHLQTDAGVQVGQGFVQQQDLGFDRQSTPQRHALALTA